MGRQVRADERSGESVRRRAHRILPEGRADIGGTDRLGKWRDADIQPAPRPLPARIRPPRRLDQRPRQKRGTVMRSSVYGFIAAVLTAAPALAASSTRLSDVEFIEASRCLALMKSKTLGEADAATLQRRLGADAGGHPSFIYDKAEEARDDAARQASQARGDTRA